MKSLRFFPLLCLLASLFLSCDRDATTSVSDGSWTASFRVASALTDSQLSRAAWVRVQASRNGVVVASDSAPYAAHSVTLTIPLAGAVDITLTGYDVSKDTVMWTGTGRIADGVANPGNVVTLVAGPGLQSSTEGGRVYAVATDYSTFAVQSVESGTPVTFEDFANAPSGGGLALSSADGVLYIINQKTGELQAWKNSAIQFDVNVGAASNPCQVLKVGNKLYVVRWNCNNLLVLGASKGDSIGSLDLSKSANKEGTVNPAKAAFIGGKLWILAQRMFTDYSYDSGMVIVADTGVATAPRGIALAAKDPQAIAAVGSNVYVASHGSWDVTTADGGFDLFNAATGAWTKNLSAVAIGKPADLVAVAGNLWAIVYTDAYTTTKVALVSTVDGSQGAAVAGLAAASTLATDGTYLWVSDRAVGDKQAVWKLNGSTGAAISSVKTAYPPAALAIVQ